jgi:hypothetical protein
MTQAPAFRVTDMLVEPADADAARALRQAVAAIERTFVDGADWRAVVGQLRLMIKILEDPPRTCQRCCRRFRLENGAAFAFFRRGMAVPRHCAACRTQRRHERAEREQRLLDRPTTAVGRLGRDGTV